MVIKNTKRRQGKKDFTLPQIKLVDICRFFLE